jgi:NDP-sugar pyrophosphorylase family protein
MKAMLLAAGLGTRLKPWTDKHPKALAIVNGKTLLQRNIEYLQRFGIKDVIVNVHHFAAQIIETTRQKHGWGSDITISDETDAILETGGGLKRAAWYFENEENFVLMNVDVLTDLPLNEMMAFHENKNALATLATTNRKTSRYFLFNEENILSGWKNLKTGEEKPPVFATGVNEYLTPRAFSGIHVVSSKIFSLIQQTEIKFSIVDVYLSLCNEHGILSFDHSDTSFIDVGKPENILYAEKIFS